MTSYDLRFVLALALVTGCGQVEPTPDPAPESGPVSSPKPGEGPPEPPSVPPARRTGYVSLNSAGGALTAHADFPIEQPLRTPRRNECELTTAQQAAPSESAGEIVIEVPARLGPQTATLTFDPSRRAYESTTLDGGDTNGRIEKADAPFRIHASGAGVPAFDVDTASAFDAKLIDPPAGAPIAGTTGDLVVRWSDGGNEAVLVSLTIVDTTVSCQFEPAAGKGVIPGALIQKAVALKPAGSCAGSCAWIGLTSLRSSKVVAGDYDISVSHALTSGHGLKLE